MTSWVWFLWLLYMFLSTVNLNVFYTWLQGNWIFCCGNYIHMFNKGENGGWKWFKMAANSRKTWMRLGRAVNVDFSMIYFPTNLETRSIPWNNVGQVQGCVHNLVFVSVVNDLVSHPTWPWQEHTVRPRRPVRTLEKPWLSYPIDYRLFSTRMKTASWSVNQGMLLDTPWWWSWFDRLTFLIDQALADWWLPLLPSWPNVLDCGLDGPEFF